MSGCAIQQSGAVELYFYDELDAGEATRVAAHVRTCRDCAEALGELRTIREALALRPDVAAPESGDWSSFMTRLDASVRLERDASHAVLPFSARGSAPAAEWRGLLAIAALLCLVALSVLLASRAGRSIAEPPETAGPVEIVEGEGAMPVRAGLAAVGLDHLERSKLVVLGLAAKEPADSAEEWQYERELAVSLLADTRLYRMAAEKRGLTTLAGVMKDLELVLLQTAMSDRDDATALPQIQRLIDKRGLVQKIDVIGTTGVLP